MSLTLEIFPDVTGTFEEVSLSKGYVAMLISTDQLEHRNDKDQSLMFMAKIISKKNPVGDKLQWVTNYERGLTQLAAETHVEYLFPDASKNLTGWTRETPKGLIETIPGAWVWQVMAPNLYELRLALDLLFQQVMRINKGETDGFGQDSPESKILVRTNVTAKNTWETKYTVTIALCGEVDAEMQQWLTRVMQDYKFLIWSGDMAACKDAKFCDTYPCKFQNQEDTVAALKAREDAAITVYLTGRYADEPAANMNAAGSVGSGGEQMKSDGGMGSDAVGVKRAEEKSGEQLVTLLHQVLHGAQESQMREHDSLKAGGKWLELIPLDADMKTLKEMKFPAAAEWEALTTQGVEKEMHEMLEGIKKVVPGISTDSVEVKVRQIVDEKWKGNVGVPGSSRDGVKEVAYFLSLFLGETLREVQQLREGEKRALVEQSKWAELVQHDAETTRLGDTHAICVGEFVGMTGADMTRTVATEITQIRRYAPQRVDELERLSKTIEEAEKRNGSPAKHARTA